MSYERDRSPALPVKFNLNALRIRPIIPHQTAIDMQHRAAVGVYITAVISPSYDTKNVSRLVQLGNLASVADCVNDFSITLLSLLSFI